MVGIRGSNELIIGEIEEFHGFSEFSTVQVGQGLGIHSLIPCGLFDFDPVFIGSRQKEDLITGKPHGSGPSVTQGGGVDVANMGPIVYVINGGCDAA